MPFVTSERGSTIRVFSTRLHLSVPFLGTCLPFGRVACVPLDCRRTHALHPGDVSPGWNLASLPTSFLPLRSLHRLTYAAAYTARGASPRPQFRRLANVYFLLLAVLSLLPISPVQPPTNIVPLVVIVGLSMLKEGLEDYQRRKQDQEVNRSQARVLHQGHFVRVPWVQVHCGDLVQVHQDEFFPADMLLIASSEKVMTTAQGVTPPHGHALGISECEYLSLTPPL